MKIRTLLNHSEFSKGKNGHNFLILHQNEKPMALSFIQLLRFDKIKCSYFFNWRPIKKMYGHFVKIRTLLNDFES